MFYTDQGIYKSVSTNKVATCHLAIALFDKCVAHFDKIIGIDGIVANGDDLKLLRMACVEIASKSRHCLTLDVHLLIHFASSPPT